MHAIQSKLLPNTIKYFKATLGSSVGCGYSLPTHMCHSMSAGAAEGSEGASNYICCQIPLLLFVIGFEKRAHFAQSLILRYGLK